MRSILAAAVTALALLPATALAVPQKFDFDVTLAQVLDTTLSLVAGSSLLGETGKVSFTVDSTSINPVGTTELTESDLLAFSFDILGQSFGIANLSPALFLGGPVSGFDAEFDDGELLTASARVAERSIFGPFQFSNLTPINADTVVVLAFVYNNFDHDVVLANGAPGVADVQAGISSAVPLPAGLPLALSGLGALALLRRRRRA